MSAEVENNDAPTDEPPLPALNLDASNDTVRADETPASTTPVHMGWTYAGGDNTQPPYAPTAPSRPIGVTIIAILNFIGAGLLLLIFVFALARGADAGLSLYLLPFQIAFAILVGVGLLQLKSWGRIIALIGYGLNVALDEISLFSTDITASTYINFVIAAIFVWYLLRPNVAAAFSH